MQSAPLDHLRELSEQEIEWMLQIGYLYIQLEKWDTAKILIETLLVFDPGNIDGLVNLAYVHMETANFDMALKICEKLLKTSLTFRGREYDRSTIEKLRRLTLQKMTDQKRNRDQK